jgi:hypothetical protein
MMGFSHFARSSSDRSVRRWIRSSRSRAFLAFSASGLIAGKKPVKFRPLLRAPPCPEGVPEKGERRVLVLGPAPIVFAIHDPRLVRVKPQADFAHSRGDSAEHMLGLVPALAVHDSIVGVTLERAARELPSQPRIKRVVHEQVRQDRRDRRPLRSSSAALLKGAVRVLERGSKPPLDIQQHPAGVGDRLHRPDDEVPRHLVENFWTSRSITQSYFQHRCRQTASAS